MVEEQCGDIEGLIGGAFARAEGAREALGPRIAYDLEGECVDFYIGEEGRVSSEWISLDIEVERSLEDGRVIGGIIPVPREVWDALKKAFHDSE